MNPIAIWARARSRAPVSADAEQSTSFSCGPAVLVVALERLGIETTEAELTDLAGTDTEGTLPAGLAQAAEALGATASLHEGLWIDDVLGVLEAGAQAILMVMGPKGAPHFVLATGSGELGDGLVVEDPATGEEVELSPDELGELWDVEGHAGVAIVVERQAAGSR